MVGVRALARLHHLRRAQARAGTPTQTAAEAETVLVVGLNAVTELFLRSVDEFASDRIKVAGIVGRSERHSGRTLHRLPILGVPEDIDAIVKTLEVHGVLINRIVVTVAFSSLSTDAQRELLAIEDQSNIRLDFFAERIGFAPSQTPPLAREEDIEEDIAADHVPLPQSDATLKLAAERGYFHFKRLADVVVAAILCCILFPIFLLVGLLVAADVGLPVIFWQQRPGRHGRAFKLYKFRTMRSAHSISGERIRDEERSSPIGNFLRRSRIDELPQLFNILIGDMSFVGPRPLLPSDQSPELAARLLVRPGLTGWAQVTGGRTISPLDKAALDLWYVRNASPWIDIVTVVRTVPVSCLENSWMPVPWVVLGRNWERTCTSHTTVAFTIARLKWRCATIRANLTLQARP